MIELKEMIALHGVAVQDSASCFFLVCYDIPLPDSFLLEMFLAMSIFKLACELHMIGLLSQVYAELTDLVFLCQSLLNSPRPVMWDSGKKTK